MSKIIFLVAIAIGLIVTVVIWQSDQYKKFLENADKVSGKLVKKEVRTFRPNQQTGKDNWALYTYVVDGHEYDGQERVEYDGIWHDLSEGQAIDVYYNKGNPGESHLVIVLDKRLGIAEGLKDKLAK